MPTRSNAAPGDEGTGPEPAASETPDDQAQPSDTDSDNIHVVWRKKDAAPAATAEPAAVDAAATDRVDNEDWPARFKEEQTRADDYFARWQRAAADMANMRRRHEQDRQEFVKQATAALIEELLPVLDSFDRALATMPAELRELTWIDGVVLVERQLRAVLQRAGLTPIDAQGKSFDPTEHEALLHETSDQPDDTVIGELQRGYKLYDRVLRPAMVKVAKN